MLRHLPNLLSFARLAMTPVVVLAILAREEKTALCWAEVACVTDALDGELARRFNWGSRLGAYLDPIADKVMLSSVYIALGLTATLPWWLVGIIFGRDILILLVAGLALAFTGVRKFSPSIWGKISTWFQMVTALVALVNKGWVSPLVWATAAATIWSGIHYGISFRRRLK